MAREKKGKLFRMGSEIVSDRYNPGQKHEGTSTASDYLRFQPGAKISETRSKDDGRRTSFSGKTSDFDAATPVSAKDYRQDKRASADEIRAKAKAKARPKAKAKAKARPAMRPATTRPKAKAAAAKAKARPKAKAQVMKPRPKAKARQASSGGSYRPPSSLERRRRR